jgi:hypothetical protein
MGDVCAAVGSQSDFYTTSPSTYAGMVNIIYDFHSYAPPTGTYSQATIQGWMTTETSSAASATSGSGLVPVWIGEYGPAPGTSWSTSYQNNVNAAQAFGPTQSGSFAWVWFDSGPEHQAETTKTGSLDSWGREIANYFATGNSTTFVDGP